MAESVVQIAPGVAQKVMQLAEVIGYLRAEVNKDLPIQHIALILAVTNQPGISMQELMTCLDMPQGSVSRNVKLLSDKDRGYELFRTAQDMVNRKQVAVFPTDKCIDLVGKLCCMLQGEMAEGKRCSCQAVSN